MVLGPDARAESQSSWRPSAAGAELRSHEFGTLFKSSFRTLWLIALGIVQDPALAEDAVQEAALIALGKLDQFRAGTSFDAWMARIVQYVALNHSRVHRRRKTVPLARASITPAFQTTDPTAAPACLAAATLAPDQPHFDDRVLAALSRLPAPARACLLLRALDGLDYTEIARRLNIPPGTAMSHVHRTRQRLRRDLADLAPPTARSRSRRKTRFPAIVTQPSYI